jgi:hypothetical protein
LQSFIKSMREVIHRIRREKNHNKQTNHKQKNWKKNHQKDRFSFICLFKAGESLISHWLLS